MISSRYPVIWCGDQNIVTNPHIDRAPPRKYKDAYSNDLINLFETFDLVDTCRFLYPSEHWFTFHRNTDTKSRIDKIMVSNQFSIEKYDQSEFSFSDHDLIKVKLKYEVCWVPGEGIWKNNPIVYKDETFLIKFIEFWDYINSFFKR